MPSQMRNTNIAPIFAYSITSFLSISLSLHPISLYSLYCVFCILLQTYFWQEILKYYIFNVFLYRSTFLLLSNTWTLFLLFLLLQKMLWQTSKLVITIFFFNHISAKIVKSLQLTWSILEYF
jgi:hypothetical protein